MTIPPLLSIKVTAYVILAALTIITGLVVRIWWLGVEVKDAEADVKTLQADLTVANDRVEQARETINSYKLAVTQQNVALEKLRADGVRRQTESTNALAMALKGRQSAEARLSRLVGRPEGAQSCKDADAEIRKLLK